MSWHHSPVANQKVMTMQPFQVEIVLENERTSLSLPLFLPSFLPSQGYID